MAALTAVLGYLWAYLFEAPVIGALVGTMFGLGALSLLAILAGWRWAPALGVLLTAVVGGLLVGANWTEFVRSVSNPRDPLYLPLALLIPPMALATGLGIAATAQNYRLAAPRRRAPRWLAPALATVGGLTAGYLLLGLLPRPLAALTVTPQTYSTLPGMETREFSFQPGELRVQSGQPVALRLMNHRPGAALVRRGRAGRPRPHDLGGARPGGVHRHPPRKLPLLLRRPRPRGQGFRTGDGGPAGGDAGDAMR